MLQLNSRTSEFINVPDIMKACRADKAKAQGIFRKVRDLAGKVKGNLVTVLNYAEAYGITLAEAMRLFKRITPAQEEEEQKEVLRIAALVLAKEKEWQRKNGGE